MKYARLTTNYKSYGKFNFDTYTVYASSKMLLQDEIRKAIKELKQDGIRVTFVHFLTKKEIESL